MESQRFLRRMFCLVFFFCLCGFAFAAPQNRPARLEVTITAGGKLIPAHLLLTSPGRNAVAVAGTDAPASVSLAPGRWQLVVTSPGLQSAHARVTLVAGEVRRLHLALHVATVAVETTVRGQAVNSGVKTTTVAVITPQQMQETQPAQPGRGVIDLVNAQPGWLLEANGTLHPRGSEYDTQYELNGIPLTENRSPVYVPPLNLLAIHALDVKTAGYSASEGRKLGGVISVSTAQPARPGLHGEVRVSAGSFSDLASDVLLQQEVGSNSFTLSAEGAHTRRYLDPPVPANFTNRANLRGAGLTGTRDGDRDHLLVYLHDASEGSLVPNEQVQQAAGQRQDRHLDEQIGQVTWQHLLSSHLIASLHGMVQQQRAQLDSNDAATPIRVAADRRRRLAYVSGDLSWDVAGQHLSAGADAMVASLQEQLQALITDPESFDPSTPSSLLFAQHHPDREQAMWGGDRVSFGPFSLDAGLRWDHYDVLVRDQGWSPRLAAAWRLPWYGTSLHASWDHTFETPASENLLLASSPLAWSVTHATTGLVLRPSRGDFYQAGLAQPLGRHLSLDGNWFLRTSHNYFDDDNLLDTGISFPISFAGARVQGTEVVLNMPDWGRFSGSVSWSNQIGTAWDPITGGLFLDPDAAGQLQAHDRFPISQDQRNTVHLRLRASLIASWWSAVDGSYGSGLPTELDNGQDQASLVAAYGADVVNNVNFARGRLFPHHSIDISGGGTIWHRGDRDLTLQLTCLNLTNRLNVINFAGLFSGTAIAPPRSYHATLGVQF